MFLACLWVFGVEAYDADGVLPYASTNIFVSSRWANKQDMFEPDLSSGVEGYSPTWPGDGGGKHRVSRPAVAPQSKLQWLRKLAHSSSRIALLEYRGEDEMAK